MYSPARSLSVAFSACPFGQFTVTLSVKPSAASLSFSVYCISYRRKCVQVLHYLVLLFILPLLISYILKLFSAHSFRLLDLSVELSFYNNNVTLVISNTTFLKVYFA